MARLITTQLRVSVGVASGDFLSSNPRRVALRFSVPSGRRISIGYTSPAVLDQDLTFGNAVAPYQFWQAYDGDIVTRHLFAVADVATTIGVWETIDLDRVA